MDSENLVRIREGRSNDRDSILGLLETVALPTSDLTVENPARFLVAGDEEGTLVGCIGLEPHGTAALLRSLAVAAPFRGHGLGAKLVSQIEKEAARRGVATLWLLTETADRFFLRQGYAPVARAAAPDAIRTTSEFRSLCPDTATCLIKHMKKGSR